MLTKVKLYRGTIVIYYSKNGVLRHNTGFRVDAKHFSESKLILKSSGIRNYDEINSNIIQIQQRIDNIILKLKADGITPSVELVKHRFKDETKKVNSEINRDHFALMDFMEEFYEMKKSSKIKPGSLKAYRSMMNAFKDYENLNNIQLRLKDINRNFLQEFEYFLSQERPYGCLTEGNLNDNTISKRYKHLKEFWKNLVERDLANENKDLDSYKVSKYETDIIVLNEVELKAVLDFKPRTARERKVKDVFVFGCMTGLRYSDIRTLDSSHIKGNIICKYAIKTGGYFEVPLNSTAMKIWERNNESLNHFILQKYNLYLKQMLLSIKEFQKEIKIKRRRYNEMEYQMVQKWTQISSHNARRTFITNCIKQNVPINEIMKMTGHSSISMLLNYMQKFGDKTFDFVDRLEIK